MGKEKEKVVVTGVLDETETTETTEEAESDKAE